MSLEELHALKLSVDLGVFLVLLLFLLVLEMSNINYVLIDKGSIIDKPIFNWEQSSRTSSIMSKTAGLVCCY